uniref:Kinesin-like protein n=1 Tax=Tetradesmus obliquus TaxID=3088 RepID=A0A383V908_TETOB|eukprot:jgi/Sobl393_1/8995/SZX60816.1
MGACSSKGTQALQAVDGDCHILVRPAGSISSPIKSFGSAADAAGFAAVVSESEVAVKVAVVARPLLPFEIEKGAANHVQLLPPNKVALPARGSSTGVNDGAYEFQFNRAFHAASSAASAALNEEMVRPVLDGFCKGFNGTVLAYGQTGSGKTYTMGTAAGRSDFSSRSGSTAVIPWACRYVLQYVAAARSKYDISIKASLVEIYNETIQDLLSPNMTPSSSSTSLLGLRGTAGGSVAAAAVSGSSALQQPSTPRSVSSEGGGSAFGSTLSEGSAAAGVSIRETGKGEIVLEGAIEAAISCLEDLAAVLEQGNAVRATASHKMNQSSSRSHAILVISMEQRALPSAARALPAELRYLRSKLHLVDLAGSERAKETGTTGARFAEGVSINRGLLELGNVINALTEGTVRRHIPYRNSKLTRLLQDSLGGNSETLFIACISPADLNRDHSISTLRYASRAMAIKNSLKLNNQMSAEEEVAYLRQLVGELQEENDKLKRLLGPGSSTAAAAGSNTAAGGTAAAKASKSRISVT